MRFEVADAVVALILAYAVLAEILAHESNNLRRLHLEILGYGFKPYWRFGGFGYEFVKPLVYG